MEISLLAQVILNGIGGLGIFLLGMRYMSDGLQTVAGSSLRRLIAMVTDNRLMAVSVGVVVTCLIQSSSVSTVMAVGFVNSGIMALHQAIGVILGANIGTTITGWILVLKIGKYGLPMIGAASFFFLFTKNEKTKYTALTIIGVGMIFFGLELMKSGFKPIKDMPEFLAWFRAFDATTYFGVLKCTAVGCILTFIIQSSSATLGITIGLAAIGVLKFDTAAALVLGENIGTTITAFLASIGTSTNAKRAAYFHVLFNVIGVLWITTVFNYYLPFIGELLKIFAGIKDVNQMVMVNGECTFPYTTTGIAAVHSVFNIINVILFLPFTHIFAKFLEKIIHDKKPVEKRYLTRLDFQMYDSAFAAIEQSKFEINKMGEHCRGMLDQLKEYVMHPEKNTRLAEKIFEREIILDTVQQEITAFLTDAHSGRLSQDLKQESNTQLQLADELESISDYVVQLLKLYIRLMDKGITLNEVQKEEIGSLHDRICNLFDIILKDRSHTFQELLIITNNIAETITRDIRIYRANHWKRLKNEKLPPLLSTTYTDLLVSYRKIQSHLIHVAEAQAGEKSSG